MLTQGDARLTIHPRFTQTRKENTLQRIFTRTVTGKDFRGMMTEAGVSRNDMIRLTGFNAIVIEKILNMDGDNRPRMADLILLRILRDYPGLKDEMMAISAEFSEGELGTSDTRYNRRSAIFGKDAS